MKARPLFLLAALAAPAQALELDQPEIRFAEDCSVTLTFRLLPGAQADPGRMWMEIASPPTYRRLRQAYPSWAGTALLEQVRHGGEDRLRIRSTEPLPAHPGTLVLVLSEGHAPPVFHTLSLPPCDASGTTREVVRGDTLFEIALDHARDLEVDAYALMLAIQLYNRDAFIHDNINLVRAGARLYLPSPAEIARLNLPRQWLIDEIRFQNEQWQGWRRDRTDLRESRTLQARRLDLVPLEVRVEADETEPAEAAPAEPEPAAAEPAEPAAAEPEPTEAAVPETIEVESEELAQLPADAREDRDVRMPWRQLLAAAGVLVLLYLVALGLRRRRDAREIQRSVGEIEDPRRRAASALDLAHAHVEAKAYDQASPLIRLVLAEGTEREREEARKLQERMRPG